MANLALRHKDVYLKQLGGYSWPLFLLLSVNVGFSKQNIVNTCFRNSLSVSTLNNLMRVSIDDSGLVNFDFGTAFQK